MIPARHRKSSIVSYALIAYSHGVRSNTEQINRANNMKTKKSPDTKAADIRFGIEIETMIPDASGISVGFYHSGNPVVTANRLGTSEAITAPQFEGATWKSERDGSIRAKPGFIPCEFVSPVLHGDNGLAALSQFIRFTNDIGAKVNDSCGLHITVGIESIIGTRDHEAIAVFCKKLARHAHEHQWAIYAQTGTDRHTNHYAHQLNETHDNYIGKLQRAARVGNAQTLRNLAANAGRGMVNFNKAFTQNPAIEFRAFASTLNEKAIFHHLATVLGIVRKTVSTDRVPSFKLCKTQTIATAQDAMKRMWKLLGWRTGSSEKKTTIAFGAFGELYNTLESSMSEAMRRTEKFETKFPAAFAVVAQPANNNVNQ